MHVTHFSLTKLTLDLRRKEERKTGKGIKHERRGEERTQEMRVCTTSFSLSFLDFLVSGSCPQGQGACSLSLSHTHTHTHTHTHKVFKTHTLSLVHPSFIQSLLRYELLTNCPGYMSGMWCSMCRAYCLDDVTASKQSWNSIMSSRSLCSFPVWQYQSSHY